VEGFGEVFRMLSFEEIRLGGRDDLHPGSRRRAASSAHHPFR
jgi:hypothetical protein